jgi:hypothetical protein
MPRNQVRLVGPVGHSDLATELRSADLFVQPSLWGEPFSIVGHRSHGRRLAIRRFMGRRAAGERRRRRDGSSGCARQPCGTRTGAMRRLAADRRKVERLGHGGRNTRQTVFPGCASGRVVRLILSKSHGHEITHRGFCNGRLRAICEPCLAVTCGIIGQFILFLDSDRPE